MAKRTTTRTKIVDSQLAQVPTATTMRRTQRRSGNRRRTSPSHEPNRAQHTFSAVTAAAAADDEQVGMVIIKRRAEPAAAAAKGMRISRRRSSGSDSGLRVGVSGGGGRGRWGLNYCGVVGIVLSIAVIVLLNGPQFVSAGFACLSNPCVFGVCVDDLNR